MEIKNPNGNNYLIDFDLFDSVQVEASSFELMSTKIEIKLAKANVGLRWVSLESTSTPPPMAGNSNFFQFFFIWFLFQFNKKIGTTIFANSHTYYNNITTKKK